MWSALDILRITTVLKDCADKVAILGHMQNFDRIRSADKKQIKQGVQDLRWAYKKQMIVEDGALSPNHLAKMQLDRQFLAGVIMDLLSELQEVGTFQKLVHIIEEEKKGKTQLLDIIHKEEETRQKIKALQKQLQDIHQEKALELQKRTEFTAYLKDQLQEMKVRTEMEKCYVTNTSKLLVYQGQKLNANKEKQLEDEIKQLRDKIEEEKRLHTEMERFLKMHQTRLVQKLEMWMERYEKDTEEKQQELNALKNNRTNNLSQLQELAKKYRESELVVMEDRMQKEQQRLQLERERIEWNAAIKVQAWWRGTLVRKGMGSHKKGKKAKASKKKKKK